MSTCFLDSSALLKRHVVEPGSRWVRRLTAPTAGHTFFVAAIVRVEVVSALARRRREGRISLHGARNVRLLAERQIERCFIVELTKPVLQRACDLLERYPLRAYDAVQLASALAGNDRLRAGGLAQLTFVSADQRLLTTAIAEGLAVEDPNRHA